MAEIILKSPQACKLVLNKETSFNEGYNRGYLKGNEDGYNSGYAVGNSDGYATGVEEGKTEGASAFWDVVQDKGNRKYYQYAFAYWGATECSPKYKIAPNNTSFANAFQGCTALKTVDWDKFDLSNCQTFNQSFNSCFVLEGIDTELAPTSAAANVWAYTFSGCNKLKRIKKIAAQETHSWTLSFNNCSGLEDVTFDGVIGNDIDLSPCTKLSRDSVESLFNALSLDVTGKTVSLSSSVENTCREYITGGGKEFAFGDTYTSNGLTFTNGGSTISWTGTLDEGTTAVCPLMTEPYALQNNMCVYIDDMDNPYSDLQITVEMESTGERVTYHRSSSPCRLSKGDVIVSVELVVSEDSVLTASYPFVVGNVLDFWTAVKDNWTVTLI